MKSFLVWILFLLLLIACRNKKMQNTREQNQNWQTVHLIRDTLDVKIPIEGKLLAWKKVDILSPVKARLVSLLVEQGDHVKSGDLILSLWPLDRKNNYSTIDIHTPLTGNVRSVYFAINDTIAAGKPVLTIENRKNLILKTTLSKTEMLYVEPNLNVMLFYGNRKIKGAVWEVDKKTQQVTVVVPNQQLHIKHDLYVKGYIDLGEIAGTFLPVHNFSFSDSIKARFNKDTLLTLRKAGVAQDSLILLYPDLPDTNTIQIKKILTL